MNRTIFHGDIFDKIKEIPNKSIDTVITSPPYYALRDYEDSGQIGHEDTHMEFLDTLQRVMNEIRRVLKPTGTAWINLGDSYAGSGKGAGCDVSTNKRSYIISELPDIKKTLPSKCRMGIPERFYAQCIDNGWIARNHIVWAKVNPMPEAVKDRQSCVWESILFFAKNNKYYFDLDAVRVEPKIPIRDYNPNMKHIRTRKTQVTLGNVQVGRYNTKHRKTANMPSTPTQQINKTHSGVYDMETGKPITDPKGKNPGDVITADYTDEELLEWIKECRKNQAAREIAPPDLWWITKAILPEAHFATFPIELPKTILKRACPPDGIVLDPFFGAGTTAVAAEQLGLQWTGIELNDEYIQIARKRLAPYMNAKMEEFQAA